jgi:hypothetical protein
MKGTSVVKMDKQRKIQMAISRIAILLAKQAGDALYDKYAKYRKLYLEYKAKIIKKYGTRAAQVVRRSLSKSE